jgi:hypothetical protein
MATTTLPRRHRATPLLVGLLVLAGTLGGSHLATGSTDVSVDASVLVKVGLDPAAARQGAAQLNAAIDSAARGIAGATRGAMPSGAPVRSTAAAMARYTMDVDAALTRFVTTAVPALVNGGTAAAAAVKGTKAVVTQVAGNLTRAAKITADASFEAGGGSRASVDLSAQLDPSVRNLLADSVRTLQPLLPLTRSTLRAVAASVRQVVDALAQAVKDIVRATVDAVVGVMRTMRTMSEQGVQNTRRLVVSAATGVQALLAAVEAVLDNPQGVDISHEVDVSLHIGS